MIICGGLVVIGGGTATAAMSGQTGRLGEPLGVEPGVEHRVHGRPFDGAARELALMDIDDLAGTLATVRAVLRRRRMVRRLGRASVLPWQRAGPQQLAARTGLRL